MTNILYRLTKFADNIAQVLCATRTSRDEYDPHPHPALKTTEVAYLMKMDPSFEKDVQNLVKFLEECLTEARDL